MAHPFLDTGFHDVFREKYPGENGHYTWWSFQKGVRQRNVGWRIDYHVVTPGLADRIRAVSIYKEQRFSDHAPLIIEYDI